MVPVGRKGLLTGRHVCFYVFFYRRVIFRLASIAVVIDHIGHREYIVLIQAGNQVVHLRSGTKAGSSLAVFSQVVEIFRVITIRTTAEAGA